MKADGQILCDNVLTMLEILHKNMFLNDQSRSNVNIINDLHRSVRILPDLWSPEHVGLGTSRVGHSDVGRDERIVLFQRHFGKKRNSYHETSLDHLRPSCDRTRFSLFKSRLAHSGTKTIKLFIWIFMIHKSW